MATDLHWLSIAEAAPLIERRALSPVELVDAWEERLARSWKDELWGKY